MSVVSREESFRDELKFRRREQREIQVAHICELIVATCKYDWYVAGRGIDGIDDDALSPFLTCLFSERELSDEDFQSDFEQSVWSPEVTAAKEKALAAIQGLQHEFGLSDLRETLRSGFLKFAHRREADPQFAFPVHFIQCSDEDEPENSASEFKHGEFVAGTRGGHPVKVLSDVRYLTALNPIHLVSILHCASVMLSELAAEAEEPSSRLMKSSDDVFVPSTLQNAILEALNKRAMKKQALAEKVCGGEGSRLYKPKGKGITELMERGLVASCDRGYYRPDAPPPDAITNSPPSRHQSSTRGKRGTK